MAEHQNDEVHDEGSHRRADSPLHDENKVEQVPKNFQRQIVIEIGKAFDANFPILQVDLQSSLEGWFESHKDVTHNGEGGNPKVDIMSTRCTYKDFMTCKPLEFKGAFNPLESQRWIASIERAFDTCHCEKEDEVTFATNQLKERADDWWGVVQREKGRERIKEIRWEEFKDLFLKHYCPRAAIERITEEFLQLRQTTETVDEITGIFFDKARFCPALLTTPEMWMTRYHLVLKTEIREFIHPSKCVNLEKMIDWARERETGRGKEKVILLLCLLRGLSLINREVVPPKGKVSKIARLVEEGTRGSVDSSPRLVTNVGRECPELKFQMEKTGEGSRVAENEVKRIEAPKPRGRAFQITTEEAKDVPDVVSGIFLLNSLPACVLFDTGASRSFISLKYANSRKFNRSKLAKALEVEIASNRNCVVTEICQDCRLLIRKEEYIIDLIPMPMQEFDVIIGMDWLSSHDAMIISNQKIVRFMTPIGKEVSVIGERWNQITLCTIAKISSYGRQGYQAFLAYVADVKMKRKELDQVPVIKEFLEVFPDDLPGAPPEREFEFKIDLIPEAKPVAKAPYR
ncbi:hypothetical protein L1987_15753 [Smallanthus sonchifolius]|uniref:Uncharacterized protein n=1 Tax=Smallanthus sonchifolius TaxID=185202 RepID=A0ACB9J6G8_9ASTR|nr:hypothetical protein L1987_15753 [Smallanthus sonchifolius]